MSRFSLDIGSNGITTVFRNFPKLAGFIARFSLRFAMGIWEGPHHAPHG
jgi:hypothetical protein